MITILLSPFPTTDQFIQLNAEGNSIVETILNE